MSSRIEQIIEEIEEFVESCKYQPLSTTKIVVNKEELEELLRELRLKTPDEIKRYQKIISNKDAILADAQAKSDSLIAEAQAKSTDSPLNATISTLGRSLVASFNILTRSSTENNGLFVELCKTPTITLSKSSAPRDITSKCPFVTGSNEPG